VRPLHRHEMTVFTLQLETCVTAVTQCKKHPKWSMQRLLQKVMFKLQAPNVTFKQLHMLLQLREIFLFGDWPKIFVLLHGC
jgi:hypothetical protein